jgi:4-alpha-glucanotransferase
MSSKPEEILERDGYAGLLDQASLEWRIEPEFWDIWGNHHVPGFAVKQAILRSLGVRCDSVSDLRQALEARRLQEWGRPLPLCLVVSGEKPISLPVRVPLELSTRTLHLTLVSEDGGQTTQHIDLATLPASAETTIGGRKYVEKAFPWPGGTLPLGYYQVHTAIKGQPGCESRLIVTPDRAWLPDALEAGGRLAGVAVSLYGVRSHRNWGCGDFTDLEQLLTWLKEDLHGSFLALNPLHAIENRQPYNTSPYLPNSALFRNPLYLDVERVAELRLSSIAQKLASSGPVRRQLAELRDAPFVEYERVWRLKRFFLKLLFREFLRHPDSPRAQSFRHFVQQQGDRLHRFATYCALWDRLHRHNRDLWVWPDWPQPYQDPASPEVAAFQQQHSRQILFHKFLQWLIDEQLQAVRNKSDSLGLPIGLYHDLALATDKCGADLWAYRPFYVSGCRVGSPPDGFAPEGQDWAFPPPNTVQHHDDGYRLFIDTIRANSRHGGALRIDHVMRLFRLYWIPDGMDARHGAYVQDSYEDLLRILALESVRGKFLIVGEDLGTVTDQVREALQQSRILSYKVFYFEKDTSGRFYRPEEYARQSLVASTTHDLPTLAGFWTGRDIEARREAGLSDEHASRRQYAERAADKQQMLDMLHQLRLLPDWFPKSAGQVPELAGELHNAIIGFLVQTPSMLMVLNQEDLTKETEQQNLPASTWQYPNWRRKMKYTVEELRAAKDAQDFAAMFRNWLARAGREGA